MADSPHFSSLQPTRLFVEIVAACACAGGVISLALPTIAPNAHPWQSAMLFAVLLALVAGPAVFWRCLAATRRVARARTVSPTGAATPRGQLGSAIGMTAVAQAFGLVVTATIVLWMKSEIEHETQTRFTREVERLEADLALRFQRPVYGMKGARGLFAANDVVKRANFKAYVESRDLPVEFPGARGFGFIERVPRASLGDFEAHERADAAPDFKVRTGGSADPAFVVKYIYPLAPNFAAWGYDLSAEPVRRAAVEQAIDSGEPVLSGHVTLLQDAFQGYGLLYFLPVYRRGSDTSSPAGRRAALTGLVYAPLVIADLMSNAAEQREPGIRFRLYEGAPDASHAVQLYESASSRAADGRVSSDRLSPAVLTDTRALTIGGRVIGLTTEATPRFAANTSHENLMFVTLGGVAMSFALALATWLLASSQVRAQSMARRMTAELDRLAKVVEHTSNAVVITDAESRIQWVNPGFERIWGYPLAEVRGRRPHELFYDDYTDAATIERIDAAMRDEQSFRGQVCKRTRNGEHRWVDIDVQPLRDADGTLVGFMRVETDVTARVEAHAELKALNAQLRERTVQAEQATQAKSRFLANMSHEIRTPMNAILGMLQLLQGTALSPRQRDYAHKTDGAARALLGLLNDILDFSKIEAGKLALERRLFSLDKVLRDLSVILAANVAGKPIELLYDVDPDVPDALIGDAMRLQQILVNLGGNAIKFTSGGAVAIRVECVSATSTEAHLRFEVVDTGIGIATEVQQHIFSGFSQAEASTTRRFGGTGLGLAICRHLVTAMGGDLVVDSAPGCGSTFAFDVRLARPDKHVAVQLDAKVRAATPRRVLVVDDSVVTRDSIAITARTLGWTVDTASDAFEATALLEKAERANVPYDALFVDFRMPVIDGRQFCQNVRRRRFVPRLIIITGQGSSVVGDLSDDDALPWVDGILIKPVTASMLRDAVEADSTATTVASLPHPALAHRRLEGLRLLLAEDNQNNQQIAQELLGGEGARVSIAHNGEEAIALIKSANPPFDLVLMDLQMPVMDGLTATARIRQDPTLAALPIVAMTANAMESDRAACLAAGMNDHVAKPFDLNDLVAAIRRLTGRAPIGSFEPEASDRTTPGAARGIDVAKALERMGNNHGAYARMLRASIVDIEGSATLLEAHFGAGTRTQAARLMHTMKGLAATLGATALAQEAGAIERACLETGDTQRDADLIARWRLMAQSQMREIERAAWELDAHLSSVTQTRPLGRTELRAALESLATLLRESDMAAVDVFEGLAVRAKDAPRPMLSELGQALDVLDFPRALRQCRLLSASLGEDA